MIFAVLPVVLFVFAPKPALADSITFSIVASTVTITNVSEAGNPSVIVASDVHGVAVVNVFDSSPSFLGPVELGNVSTTFGEAVVFDSDYPGLTQAVGDTLDFLDADFSGLTTQVLGTGSVVLGPITDPALLPFLGDLDFGFALDSATVDGNNQTISKWDMVSIATPEPSSLALLFTGLLLLAFFASRNKMVLRQQN